MSQPPQSPQPPTIQRARKSVASRSVVDSTTPAFPSAETQTQQPLRVRTFTSTRNLKRPNQFTQRAEKLRKHVEKELQPREQGPGIGKGGIRRMATLMNKRLRRENEDRLRRLRVVEQANQFDNDIPLRPFHRLVKQIINELFPNSSLRLQVQALHAMRNASEAFILALFEQCYLFTAHAKRVTLMTKDMELARRMPNWNLR